MNKVKYCGYTINEQEQKNIHEFIVSSRSASVYALKLNKLLNKVEDNRVVDVDEFTSTVKTLKRFIAETEEALKNLPNKEGNV